MTVLPCHIYTNVCLDMGNLCHPRPQDRPQVTRIDNVMVESTMHFDCWAILKMPRGFGHFLKFFGTNLLQVHNYCYIIDSGKKNTV